MSDRIRSVFLSLLFAGWLGMSLSGGASFAFATGSAESTEGADSAEIAEKIESTEKAESWICKKRSRQVYNAFYRTELRASESGEIRFDYGVGDKLQIYELYFTAPVIRVAAPANVLARYESPVGDQPRVVIEIKEERKKVKLEFTVTPANGKPDFRDDYVCE